MSTCHQAICAAEVFLREGGDLNMLADGTTGSTILHVASECNLLDLVHFVAQSGVNMEAKDGKGHSALALAASRGHTRIVECLHQLGADITTTMAMQAYSPISFAAMGGQLSVFEYLHSHGVDVNSRNNKGFTAFTLAAENNHLNVLREWRRHVDGY